MEITLKDLFDEIGTSCWLAQHNRAENGFSMILDAVSMSLVFEWKGHQLAQLCPFSEGQAWYCFEQHEACR